MAHAGQTGPRVERLSQARFHVLGLRELSPEFSNRAEAEKWLRAQLAALPEAQRPRLRPCLCCRRVFESEGIHNRLCNPCRASGRSPALAGSIDGAGRKVRFAAGKR